MSKRKEFQELTVKTDLAVCAACNNILKRGEDSLMSFEKVAGQTITTIACDELCAADWREENENKQEKNGK